MTGSYNGEYDNLLFYFSFFYSLIQEEYKTGRMSHCTFAKIPDYVKYETEEKEKEKKLEAEKLNQVKQAKKRTKKAKKANQVEEQPTKKQKTEHKS